MESERLCNAASCIGLTKIGGIESMATMVITSLEHWNCLKDEIIRSLERAGSIGKFDIFFPNAVSLPKLSKAPRHQRSYWAVFMVSIGGRSRKGNFDKSSTCKYLRSRMVLLKLVRCISGIGSANISFAAAY
ncbi:hypothetical protein OGATHE_004747 [Ogataea polymorpha]|uniref:Uncharacterized protein n=1 Tax=Ogataea polymorpha TaxID=460523 RepID=A0A9P8T2V7_9ASCO|nr:hypothetical protein OGATHE_004747 [Ogataea polymorpha]